MSPTPPDALVEDLRRRADAVTPPMALDSSAVLAAGRRHRRRSVGLRAGGGVLVAVVLALAVPLTAGSWDAHEAPIGTDGERTSPPATPSPVPGATTVPLPPGSATRVTPTVTMAQAATPDPRGDALGVTAYDLGLVLPGTTDGARSELLLVVRDSTKEVATAFDDTSVQALLLGLRPFEDGALADAVVQHHGIMESKHGGSDSAGLADHRGNRVVLASVHGGPGARAELVGADGSVTGVPLFTVPEAPGLVIAALVVAPAASADALTLRVTDAGEGSSFAVILEDSWP